MIPDPACSCPFYPMWLTKTRTGVNTPGLRCNTQRREFLEDMEWASGYPGAQTGICLHRVLFNIIYIMRIYGMTHCKKDMTKGLFIYIYPVRQAYADYDSQITIIVINNTPLLIVS